MAVKGTPYVIPISPTKMHVGDLIVPAKDQTTIAFRNFVGNPADVILPLMPHWVPYVNHLGATVYLREAITLTICPRGVAGGPLSVSKGGITTDVFQLVLGNDAPDDTRELELTISFG